MHPQIKNNDRIWDKVEEAIKSMKRTSTTVIRLWSKTSSHYFVIFLGKVNGSPKDDDN